MKANAPEKIYIFEYQLPRENHVVRYGVNQDTCVKGLVEYTRTDAFIEKAADYIKRHSALLDSDGNDCMPEWLEKFKEAMKEE